MTTIRMLDLFCGAGGASMGYHQAGFEMVGVDLSAQPHYPFTFIRANALKLDDVFLGSFDAVHASPPCQCYSSASLPQRSQGKRYVDLVAQTRILLQRICKPWIIENVQGAPLNNPLMLCGTMFDLPLYRHRYFESSCGLTAPTHKIHTVKQAKMGRAPKPGEYMNPVGHFSGVGAAQKAMEIAWMGQKELAQAIPPPYTRFIGSQLLRSLQSNNL